MQIGVHIQIIRLYDPGLRVFLINLGLIVPNVYHSSGSPFISME